MMAFVSEPLFLEAEPHPARRARAPAVVKDHHGLLPNLESIADLVARPGATFRRVRKYP
jgi:hypothetical protein